MYGTFPSFLVLFQFALFHTIESEFKWECNIVRTGEDGFLESCEELADVSNSLFDGESLLDTKYFS